MRKFQKYKEKEIKQRKGDLLYPMKCVKCGKIIKKKSFYYYKRAYEAHVDCVNDDEVEKRAMS